jgi:hypothetical protein
MFNYLDIILKNQDFLSHIKKYINTKQINKNNCSCLKNKKNKKNIFSKSL